MSDKSEDQMHDGKSFFLKTLDFEDKWYGMRFSQKYWNDIRFIREYYFRYKSQTVLIPDLCHSDAFSVLLLEAFMKEMKRQMKADQSFAFKFLKAVSHNYDFIEEIILPGYTKQVIKSFSIDDFEAEYIAHTSHCLYAGSLVFMDFMPRNKNMIIMCFDNGWQISLAIPLSKEGNNSVNDIIEHPLILDVCLEGMPVILPIQL